MPKEFLISSSENTSFGAKFLKNAADARKPECHAALNKCVCFYHSGNLKLLQKISWKLVGNLKQHQHEYWPHTCPIKAILPTNALAIMTNCSSQTKLQPHIISYMHPNIGNCLTYTDIVCLKVQKNQTQNKSVLSTCQSFYRMLAASRIMLLIIMITLRTHISQENAKNWQNFQEEPALSVKAYPHQILTPEYYCQRYYFVWSRLNAILSLLCDKIVWTTSCTRYDVASAQPLVTLSTCPSISTCAITHEFSSVWVLI